MKLKRKQRPLLFLAVLMFMIALPAGYLDAMHFDVGDDAVIDMDVQLIYAAGIRVKEPHPNNLNSNPADPDNALNTDDGTRNFDQWDLINSRFSAIVDIDLQYKNFGYFIRPKAFYDFVYMTDNANDSPTTNNSFVGGIIQDNNDWPSEVKKVHGRNVELLDYFGYAYFELGTLLVDLRAGNQVVQWGESVFNSGIAGAMAHIDIATATTPGSEVKEYLLPSQSVSLNVDITEKIAIGGYYQWDWEHGKYFEAGTFFNFFFDGLDKTFGPLLLAPGFGIPRVKDFIPDDEYQYGIKFLYRGGPEINMTEFGFYYIHYLPKNALDTGLVLPFPSAYLGVYWPEHVDVYAASFTSQIGETNVNGEVGYYRDWPIATDPTNPIAGWTGNGFIMPTEPKRTPDDFVQAQISASYIYAAPPMVEWLFDSAFLMGEVVMQYVTDLDTDELLYDKFAWAANFLVSPSRADIIDGIDLGITFYYAWLANGTTEDLGATGLHEGNHSFSTTLNFDFYDLYQFSLRYADYWDRENDGLNDRTNISCKLTYTF